MYTQLLTSLFTRELNTLIKELNLFKSDDAIWETVPGVSNSAGNLSLHIIGNLNHFVGHMLGNTDYVRNRDLEFSAKSIEKSRLISDLESTIELIKKVLPTITEENLNSDFPYELNGQKYKTDMFLNHLLLHLSYHLGQVNYLRRFLEA